MTNLENYKEKIFDDIKHVDEFGNEYWLARELMSTLEYSKWQNFHKVIKQAMIACKASNNVVLDQFTEVSKLISGGKGNVINKARTTCKNSNVDINEQFVDLDKLSINVNGGKRIITDYKLTQ